MKGNFDRPKLSNTNRPFQIYCFWYTVFWVYECVGIILCRFWHQKYPFQFLDLDLAKKFYNIGKVANMQNPRCKIFEFGHFWRFRFRQKARALNFLVFCQLCSLQIFEYLDEKDVSALANHQTLQNLKNLSNINLPYAFPYSVMSAIVSSMMYTIYIQSMFLIDNTGLLCKG